MAEALDIQVVDQFADPLWRLSNLYRIVNDSGIEVHFEPNFMQKKFLDDMWYLNVIVKGRQHGMTSLLCMVMLDACVFNPNINAGIIAHTLDDVKKIFRRKIKFPYENLPEGIRGNIAPTNDTQNELILSNGSEIGVDTSMRSGTLNYLLVSEYGKIAQLYPERAIEIKTGSFNTVHPGNFMFVESTGHGKGGEFYDLVKQARDMRSSGRPLSKLDFKYHFYPWWMNPLYKLSKEESENVVFTRQITDYFAKVEKQMRITLSLGQRAWYVTKLRWNGDEMKREMPSCVVENEQVFSRDGVCDIRDVAADGAFVVSKYEKGVKPAYKVRTELGYELSCTEDHAIKTGEGFVQLRQLKIGDVICLGTGDAGPSGTPQTVSYNQLAFVRCHIAITEDFAEFLGFFMGDGCFYRTVIAIACDAQDQDVVNRVAELMERFLGRAGRQRVRGCENVRVGNMRFQEPLMALGALRQNSSQNWKRKVWVPDYIKRSPLNVVRSFLRGLFEADGFAQRNGSGVKFFTAYEEFGRDVQLLLLRFGITCRRTTHDKIDKNGCVYGGWELSLRMNEGIAFADQIGFVSERKQARVRVRRKATVGPTRFPIATTDQIASIETIGERRVMDITTTTGEFCAGGIVVHNCPDEPFEAVLKGAYFGSQMQEAREQGRITRVPFEKGLPVDTWWDLGMRDKMAIWFVQTIGREFRFIDYHEITDRTLEWHLKEVCNKRRIEKGYQYRTHIGPHDLTVRESTRETVHKTRWHFANSMGYHFLICPQADQDDQIDAARNLLPICWFDEEHCSEGIIHLEQFRKEWNQNLGTYMNNWLHDEHSHGSSAFMTGAFMSGGLQHRKARAQPVQRSGFAT